MGTIKLTDKEDIFYSYSWISKEFQRLIMDLNRILSRMEDRLDSIEAIRGWGIILQHKGGKGYC